MPQVHPAEPYRPCELGSFGKAEYMLLRQFNFPDTYRDDEQHLSADSDRCFMWDYDHARRCFQEHTGTGELALEGWLQKAKDERVMKFIIDILKADKSVKWTGYRVMGTVNRANGYPVWTLGLFAKGEGSETKVYTGSSAPNILRRPRHVH